MQAVIFAAGQSTRTYPLTLTRPKPLLKIVNRTILEHQLTALSGIVDEIVLVVGYKAEMIQEQIGNSHDGLAIRYVTQEEQKGTGHALLVCKDVVNGPFLAMNGDDIYHRDDLAVLAEQEQASLVKTIEDPRLYCIYDVDDRGRVKRLVEKPAEIFSNLAGIGAYKFSPSVFQALEKTPLSKRGEIEITTTIQLLADESAYGVVEAKGHWLPIGYPWHLLQANQALMDAGLDWKIEGDVHESVVVNGDLALGPGSVIRPGTVIDGPAVIGQNSEIGPNAWIRPYTAVGDGCKVGHVVEVKGSIIMDGAKAPHLSYVGDSVIGCDVNFGCGTVTANFRHDEGNHKSMVKGELVDTGRRKLGAIVGDGVHTGINTSIYPGRKLWPGTSTLPGEVVQRDKEA